ncbi:hypothetical protein JMJ77_0005632 [Colletotrichum scovillei]|uniref:Uncharacterized protein n=1 Tax=Colletotrichum scovillei TaxID=1209932 RepID=A0A9P7UIE9_9PEZI|nr:hypothetical protein JMJ77_0005632 [Colletotrichum scovillei]KAG7076862.1 hypothetical protein JMJ76_0014121 [Colletotrichum scovillei]KAG7084030.1 hypothetical protein JMJ78_0009470 [Colletotrichum scovillei]
MVDGKVGPGQNTGHSPSCIQPKSRGRTGIKGRLRISPSLIRRLATNALANSSKATLTIADGKSTGGSFDQWGYFDTVSIVCAA